MIIVILLSLLSINVIEATTNHFATSWLIGKTRRTLDSKLLTSTPQEIEKIIQDALLQVQEKNLDKYSFFCELSEIIEAKINRHKAVVNKDIYSAAVQKDLKNFCFFVVSCLGVYFMHTKVFTPASVNYNKASYFHGIPICHDGNSFYAWGYSWQEEEFTRRCYEMAWQKSVQEFSIFTEIILGAVALVTFLMSTDAAGDWLTTQHKQKYGKWLLVKDIIEKLK